VHTQEHTLTLHSTGLLDKLKDPWQDTNSPTLWNPKLNVYLYSRPPHGLSWARHKQSIPYYPILFLEDEFRYSPIYTL